MRNKIYDCSSAEGTRGLEVAAGYEDCGGGGRAYPKHGLKVQRCHCEEMGNNKIGRNARIVFENTLTRAEENTQRGLS